MGTAGLVALDLAAMVALAAVWIAAAVLWPGGSGGGRIRVWRWVLAAAVVLLVVRGGLVVALAGRGWWFAQEKVLLSLPLLVIPAAVALVALARGATDLVRPALLATGYAAVVGLLGTLVVGYPLRLLPAVLLAGGWAAAAAVTWAAGRARGGAVLVTRALAVVVAVTLIAGLVDGWWASRPDRALDLSAHGIHSVHGTQRAHAGPGAAFAPPGQLAAPGHRDRGHHPLARLRRAQRRRRGGRSDPGRGATRRAARLPVPRRADRQLLVSLPSVRCRRRAPWPVRHPRGRPARPD